MSRDQLLWTAFRLLLLLLPSATADLAHKISVNSRGQFVDGFGRVRIFHGINSVLKQPPWYPDQMLNASRLRAYQDWGFNAVRLGTMWAGVQPRKDAVNATYLAVLSKIVTTLAEHGMYSIMDMHQDVLTSKYGSYDGVPRWLVDSFPPPPQPYPWPLPGPPTPSQWAEGYITWAVGSAFQYLYKNESGSLTHWANFWRSVASAVRTSDHVLGYELINEPWAGDVYNRPALLLPGVAGRDNLLPVYDYLTQVLAKEDPSRIVFYEPVTWSLVVGGTGSGGTGFDRLPGGPANANRSALSYHYYCWIVSPGDGIYPLWKRLACDALLLTRNLENAKEATAATGGGRFLTEFGLCAPTGQANATGTIECNEVLQRTDEEQQSWTYWDSNFTRADGSWNWDVVRSFARAYPMATAGQPVSYSFNLTSGRFDFAYQPDPKVRAPTVVFLPMSVHYPSGVSVNVTGGYTSRLEGNQLLVQPPSGTRRGARAAADTVVTVTVTRK
ncbi:hypothetical protein BOX15_Mlig021510g1 [Macrostomum lignano]|uniref:Endoglycoceramidase n=2 Tax=Macrostomum lignano TaxID=282301 RepID=A0A267DVP4_9PLAT|nr:hypothetical protein BOX15_Mlig021510g1 [Macrostomum lignano]